MTRNFHNSWLSVLVMLCACSSDPVSSSTAPAGDTPNAPVSNAGATSVPTSPSVSTASAGQSGGASANAGSSAVAPDAGQPPSANPPDVDSDAGAPLDAGPPPVACDPADATGAPAAIDFVASEYANFEVGAINFEPDAVTGMDTPNTGPYEPIIEVYPQLDQFTIYRPAQIDKPLQVIAWGNGGCAKHGTLHGDFLKELASYGYFVIADGAPGEKDNRGFGGPMSAMDETQQKLMLDWAFAENDRPCSPFYRKLDLAHVSVAGNSCGGLMTMYAAPDPRIATAVLFNSGLFAREPMVYDALHAPMAIFNGGPEDFAGANGELDFEAIDNIPIFIANDTRGHGSYLWDDNAGEVGPVAVAWFNWMLRGDQGPTGKGMFVGDNCGMCTKPDVWIDMKWKNLDRIK